MARELRPGWFLLIAMIVALAAGILSYVLFNQAGSSSFTVKSKLMVLDCSNGYLVLTNHGKIFPETNMTFSSADGTALFNLSVPVIGDEGIVRVRLPAGVPAGEYVLSDGGREVRFSCH